MMNGEENRYIFLTNEIGNVGGGQLYVVHKSHYMEGQGYRPGVAFFLESEIMIDEMRSLSHRFIREMQLPFASTTGRVRRRALAKFIDLIESSPGVESRYASDSQLAGESGNSELHGSPGEVVIESYTPRMALWGEWFAYQLRLRGLRVRHLLQNITEGVTLTAGGARELTLHMIEDNRMRVIAADYLKVHFPDIDCNAVELNPEYSPGQTVGDVAFPQASELSAEGFTMLSLGRLDKPYMNHMTDAIIRFAAAHPGEIFNVIYVGGAPHGRYLKAILKQYDGVENVRVVATGHIYPIPREAMRMADVMLGDSNSLKVARQEGVPPLGIDSVDFKGIGIYGETTESLLYRSMEEPPIEIDALLEWVYMERKMRREMRIDFEPYVMESDYTAHQRWMSEVGEGCWPEIMTLRPQSRRERLMKAGMALGGERIIYLLKRWRARRQNR